MSARNQDDVESVPVYVIESIPVHGDHRVSLEEREREAIPTPAHLRLGPELGHGAMGHVHSALDRNLLRHVALKRLDKHHVSVDMYRDGFIAEAQITGQLEHPNIVPVHELAVGDNGVPYFTMKLVRGADFKQWLANPERPPGSVARLEQGLEIIIKICDAVAYAHHRGVIHRDLKPENIMVGDFGQVYLMDFGLARLMKTKPASGARAQMEAHGPVGTVTYMAPEQALGDPDEMDERSDVFGLGALLYELVSGQTPYGRPRNMNDAFFRATGGKVIPLKTACAGVPVPLRLEEIVMKAVAPAKSDRYQSVVELQKDLRDLLRGGIHLPTETFAPGSMIIREGDRGDKAYMITQGTCCAYRVVDGQRETLTTMSVGEVFGEMALLLDEPRAASVEAVDRVTVLVLDKKTMNEGIGVNAWTSALVRAMAHRFRNLEQQVRDSGMRR
ncbi:MAG TPA: protein kinase [Polyangiaceae bacterium]|jgi:serine/threonine-protein kinase|nr:MAG: Serine/threonine-protein kinase PknD [Deltaproteobacteria bacterium ADurb.Bin207]HNS99106.1 protein kinase [Polyangiaceae bacterium]HNZ21467.1 protein kinase [Polyangiaceae bacterium]HOD23784.1 protein kinase [Polyangiaceae bacterium]HOE51270.1 protein kinase [Polyangiaceae bacterium]